MHPVSRTIKLTRAVALSAAAGLVLASCGSGEEQTAEEPPTPSASPSPTSTVAVPEGASLTEVGADLSFGDTATVIHEPSKKTGTVLDLTVTKAVQGSTKDFSGFILDDYAKAATPYYVDVTVTNSGEGDVGGSPVPLWGVDAANTLLPPATFTTTFGKCESAPLPKKFEPGDEMKTCLVFLAPDGGTMEAVSYRPNQEFDPITWTGDIATPAPEPTKKAKSKKGDKGKSQR